MIRLKVNYIFLLLAISCTSNLQAQVNSKKLVTLSFNEIIKLNKKDRHTYLRALSKNLISLEAQKKSSKYSHFLKLFSLIEIAHAEDELRCIGGGVPVIGGADSNCGANSYAGFTCPSGQEICNPFIFGIKNNGEPVCYQNATTAKCYKNAIPGRNTTTDPVYNKENAREEYEVFRATLEGICAGEVQIHERQALVQSACAKVAKQTQINRERNLQGFAESDNAVVSFTPPAAPAVDGTTSGLFVVKLNESAGTGSCLPVDNPLSDPFSTLRRNDVRANRGSGSATIDDPNDSRVQALARATKTIDEIGNGEFSLHRGVGVHFLDEWGASSQTSATRINIRKQNQNQAGTGTTDGGQHNCAGIVHELGHKIGNSSQDGSTIYAQYNRAVSSRCRLSGYSSSTVRGRNEEFAENFAAYITNPGFFAGKGTHCESSFNFFANLFGETNIQMSCESRRNSLTPPEAPVATPTAAPPTARPSGNIQ
ncbi:MAG: hypothetical protein ACRBBP_10170 [Bdellovibrionales bacterium]